jgi:hypothetical protein
VPVQVFELLRHPNAMRAMMSMKKLDIAELERAAREAVRQIEKAATARRRS